MAQVTSGPGGLAPDPKKFDDPHQYATWIAGRRPQFKTHKTLGGAKGAISSRAMHHGKERHLGPHTAVWVYEFSFEEGWVEVAHLAQGAVLEQSDWYSTPSKAKGAKGPSEASVDAAIRSIMNTSS